MSTLFAAGRIPARASVYRLMNTPSTHKFVTARFVVTRRGAEIDTVFFNAEMTSAEVQRSLIDHDGYPSDITVRRDA